MIETTKELFPYLSKVQANYIEKYVRNDKDYANDVEEFLNKTKVPLEVRQYLLWKTCLDACLRLPYLKNDIIITLGSNGAPMYEWVIDNVVERLTNPKIFDSLEELLYFVIGKNEIRIKE